MRLPYLWSAGGVLSSSWRRRAADRGRRIATGPDGALWFTEQGLGSNGVDKIGRVTTDGIATEFAVPTGGSSVTGIAKGSDGALWFTEHELEKTGRITTAGAVTEFPLPPRALEREPNGIVAGPDGALWFTEFRANLIGRITTAGAITEFPLPTPARGPYWIAAGSDGALWFTEVGVNPYTSIDQIGRITTGGTVTEFALAAGRSPYGIAAGPDGALWFAERYLNRIGRITTARPLLITFGEKRYRARLGTAPRLGYSTSSAAKVTVKLVSGTSTAALTVKR